LSNGKYLFGWCAEADDDVDDDVDVDDDDENMVIW
jgi:hypothetical protein